jgi:YgiT-type zinc finger domain-containing protein
MQCGTCGHPEVRATTTTVEEWHEGKLYVVRDVPVERCPNCGEEYFAPDVVDALERLLDNPTDPEPITAFALQYA